jgi:hypothetical protein
VFKVKTADGVIVLENVPENAVVEVDGEKVTVTPKDGEPVKIEAQPGKHGVLVKRGADVLLGDSVTIESGKQLKLTVRLEPPSPAALPDPKFAANPAPAPVGSDNVNVNSSASRVTPKSENRRSGPPQDAALALRGKAQVVSGEWVVDGQELVHTDDSGDGVILFGDASWTDYEFKVDLMRTDGEDGAAQLAFRRVVRNGDQLGFGMGSNGCSIDAMEDSKERNLKHSRVRIIADQKWYHAQVSVRGENIVCTVSDDSGTALAELAVADDRHPMGRVGLATENGDFRFKNITVTAPDGKTLWEMSSSSDDTGQAVANRTAEIDRDPPQPPVRPVAPAQKGKVEIVAGGEDWVVENGELVQKGKAGVILLGDEEWSNYDLKFEGQVVEGDEGFVALFHHTDEKNHRFFHVGELAGRRIDLGLLHNGEEGAASSVPSKIVKRRWYKVWIKVRGAECWCYLDEKQLIHKADTRFTKGRVGLATWDASARFRNIVVTTPEGKVLWQGPPDIPRE